MNTRLALHSSITGTIIKVRRRPTTGVFSHVCLSLRRAYLHRTIIVYNVSIVRTRYQWKRWSVGRQATNRTLSRERRCSWSLDHCKFVIVLKKLLCVKNVCKSGSSSSHHVSKYSFKKDLDKRFFSTSYWLFDNTWWNPLLYNSWR